MKHGARSVMIWAPISSILLLLYLLRMVKLLPVTTWTFLVATCILLVQVLFPNNDTVFRVDDLPIHTARSVHSWFEEREDALQHLLWLAQSPT